MPLLSTLNLAALHSLAVSLDLGDASVLRRATRLTHLELSRCSGIENGNVVGSILASLTGLRSLKLVFTAMRNQGPEAFQLTPVLQALTGLTKLVCGGNFVEPDDLRACAALPCLRSLGLGSWCTVTPVWLPPLQAMSGLTELSLSMPGWHRDDVTPEFRAGFDVERLRRGWPRLKLDW
jgi:hypothetical protein